MAIEPLIFNLTELVEYSKKGDFHKTATFELNGPGMDVFDLTSELSQLVMRALMDAQEYSERLVSNETPPDSSPEMSADAIKVILLSSKNVKFSSIADVCRKLFVRVGTYDGEVKLKDSVFCKLSISDFTRLVCSYIANFIFPSLFSSTVGE